MLENVYEGLNARSKVYLSKLYVCEMYLTCMSSKLCELIPKRFSKKVFQTVSEKMLEVAQRKPGASNSRSAGDNNEEECHNNYANDGNDGNPDGDVFDRRQVQIVDDREEPRAKSGCCGSK